MILSYIQNISTSSNILLYASNLAALLGKTFGVLNFADSSASVLKHKKELNERAEQLNIQLGQLMVDTHSLLDLTDICETNEVSFLFLQLTDDRSKSIQKLLNACRDLRIPYLLFRDSFNGLKLNKVLMPVNFLEEEVEKAQFAAAFGRFCHADILILQANDYGSKAERNVNKMRELFDKFDFKYAIEKGVKDSFKIDIEAVTYASLKDYDLIIASASREYGLDDIIFGSKELKMVRKALKPILLINPRADLYALCD